MWLFEKRKFIDENKDPETWKNKKSQAILVNEDFRKKATDPRWYKKAFLTFKTTEKKLNYSATYKVSNKL